MNEKTIEIPALNLKSMVVGVKGTTALLTNRFGEKSRQKIEDKQQKKAKLAKEARVPEEEFMDACHMIKPGIYGFPAVGIKKALVVAGGRFADEKMTHLRGVINIMGDLIPIIADGPPKMRSDTVRLQGGVTSIAYRPMFDPWAMEIPVKFNASIIGPDQVLNLFQIAGFAVGFGAWRPECNGIFGQFVIDGAGVAMAAE